MRGVSMPATARAVAHANINRTPSGRKPIADARIHRRATQMTKHTTIARRIEEMLSLYEALNGEATRWLISTSKRSRLLGAQAFRKA